VKNNHSGGDSIPKQTFLNLNKAKQERIVNCAFDEFASTDFEHAKLSNIIKNAKIPRGSLYQYFEDKSDLYLYLIDLTANRKMEYIKELFDNPMDLPFLELFRKMYVSGIQFSIENPRMVEMFAHLLAHKGKIYDDVFRNNIDIAVNLYISMIDRDKELGRIKKDIDSEVFAKLVIDMTTNISVREIEENNQKFDFERMYERISQVIKIFEHGVMEDK
jgi:AcrR family transcriptional regulator